MKVFPRAGVDISDSHRLYVQFSDSSCLSAIYRNVSKLRNTFHKVSFYAPYTHQDQLKYLGSLAYKYRYPDDANIERCRTRTVFGHTDLVLQVRPISSNLWSTVKVNNLPPIQVRAMPSPSTSSSPPTGRNRQDENVAKKRAATSPLQS